MEDVARDHNDGHDPYIRDLRARIKQIEEALREAEVAVVEAAIPLEVLAGVEADNESLSPELREGIAHAVEIVREAVSKAAARRAALSPSDTEEEA